MAAIDAAQTIEEVLLKSNLSKNQKSKLLSDNGSSYVALDFKYYLESLKIKPTPGSPGHLQTQGKIERYQVFHENVIKLDVYYSPMKLGNALKSFVDYYNQQHYHES